MKDHNEFVCEFNNGKRDWVDPVIEITESESTIKINNGANSYEYNKSDIKKWIVRPYTEDTTLNEID